MTFKEKLIELNACNEAIQWAGEKTIDEAWDVCNRGDWMLWLFRRSKNYNHQTLTLAKGHCANTVIHLMKDQRSIDAVDIAIRFGEGKATRDELNTAYDADAYADAYAAYAAAYADSAAAYAADAAAYAAAAAATYAASADSAASAAYAASAASADSYAKKQNQQLTADICRKYLPIPIL